MSLPRVAINGFGRMGRIALRDALRGDHTPPFQIVRVNEIAGDAAAAAHLFEFDSTHGRAELPCRAVTDPAGESGLQIGEQQIAYTSYSDIDKGQWDEIDIVLESTGVRRSASALAPYFEAGVKKVVVSAPVKDGSPNVVMGVNLNSYDPLQHQIVTAASCTTNCIAPVISVLLDRFGIRRGAFTSIHALTNTQRVLDAFHSDLRRSRASGASLIPTTTGSASAIFEIYPQLRGLLDGVAVRVPVTQASLADCTFQLGCTVTSAAVNEAFVDAAEGPLKNILGVEERPLVSVDYEGERRSAVLDAPSTRVVDGDFVKVLAWYDNESGYVARMMELLAHVARTL